MESMQKQIKYRGLAAFTREAADHLMAAMFPMHFGSGDAAAEQEEGLKALRDAIAYVDPENADTLTEQVRLALPGIKSLIDTDVQAAYEGDPAAISPDEVILCYPAFRAISIYRIAHVLYGLKVPIIPRMMTEREHSITGIDIHPGATIGEYFFIDHGTGVVIGETCIIGKRVKLYQHVTLGAKSFQANPDGSLVKGIKRHPDIGDNVVIYSGATILGGDTHVGENCVIGGSVWLTHSLEAGRMITNKD